MSTPVVLHLLAADGATFDLTVVLPPIRSGNAQVRVSTVQALSIQETKMLTAGAWVAPS